MNQFVKFVAATGGEATLEQVLLELARRLMVINEFSLTPKSLAREIGGLLADLDEARDSARANSPETANSAEDAG